MPEARTTNRTTLQPEPLAPKSRQRTAAKI